MLAAYRRAEAVRLTRHCGPEKKIDIRPVELVTVTVPDFSQPNDVPARLALEERGPSVHQRATAIEGVAADIGSLRRVADDAKSMGLAGWRQFVRVDEGAGSASAFRKPLPTGGRRGHGIDL